MREQSSVLLNLDSSSRFCDMMSFKCQVGVLTLGESLVLHVSCLLAHDKRFTAIKSYMTLCISSVPTSWNDQGFSQESGEGMQGNCTCAR